MTPDTRTLDSKPDNPSMPSTGHGTLQALLANGYNSLPVPHSQETSIQLGYEIPVTSYLNPLPSQVVHEERSPQTSSPSVLTSQASQTMLAASPAPLGMVGPNSPQVISVEQQYVTMETAADSYPRGHIGPVKTEIAKMTIANS